MGNIQNEKKIKISTKTKNCEFNPFFLKNKPLFKKIIKKKILKDNTLEDISFFKKQKEISFATLNLSKKSLKKKIKIFSKKKRNLSKDKNNKKETKRESIYINGKIVLGFLNEKDKKNDFINILNWDLKKIESFHKKIEKQNIVKKNIVKKYGKENNNDFERKISKNVFN